MKKRLAGIAALAALIATPALAADLSRPIYTKAPPPPPPAFSWSGCYLGGHVGGAWARTRVTDVGNGAAAFATAGVPGQEFDSDTSGVIGGGQVGCNWQSNNFVFGLEGDVGYLGIRGSVLDPGTTSNTMVGIDNGIYGDITGRIGFAWGPALIYAKAGGAWYGGGELFSTTSGAFISQSHVGTFSGWTAGGGVEYHIQGPWSGKVEYRHFDFGTQTFNVLATGGTFPFREKLNVDAVTVGLNFKFM